MFRFDEMAENKGRIQSVTSAGRAVESNGEMR